MTDEDLDNGLRVLTWRGNSISLGRTQDFKCVYCDCDLLQSIADYDRWNIDHIDPTVTGPERDALDNTAVACRLCNNIKRRYRPQGSTLAERLADVKRYVLIGRAQKQARLDAVVQLVTAYRAARRSGDGHTDGHTMVESGPSAA